MSLPCNARDPGSVPGPGRCHVPQSSEASAPPQLSLPVTATKAHLARDAAPQEEPLQGETRAPQERGAPLLQAEKACVQQQRPTTAKKKKNLLKKRACILQLLDVVFYNCVKVVDSVF